MKNLEFSQACKWCLNQCFMANDDGMVEHPCCAWWIGAEGKAFCEACRTAEAMQHSDREREEWIAGKT